MYARKNRRQTWATVEFGYQVGWRRLQDASTHLEHDITDNGVDTFVLRSDDVK